jgi:hypothetical protein
MANPRPNSLKGIGFKSTPPKVKGVGPAPRNPMYSYGANGYAMPRGMNADVPPPINPKSAAKTVSGRRPAPSSTNAKRR